jgi:hypothetical protein
MSVLEQCTGSETLIQRERFFYGRDSIKENCHGSTASLNSKADIYWILHPKSLIHH